MVCGPAHGFDELLTVGPERRLLTRFGGIAARHPMFTLGDGIPVCLLNVHGA